jgi:nucleoside 2-deoxyribosyltransferase
MPSNNGIWKSLRSGDIALFLRSHQFLWGYGVIESTYSNSEAGLQDFPLGIRFRQIIETPEIDLSLEIAKVFRNKRGWGGIFDIHLEFASLALQAARKSRGGSRMWVTPNPLLIAETDIDPVENEIFVVMPWEHRLSVFRNIKDVCEREGFVATYAAETGGQVIMEDIWRLLNRARAIVIDFTGSRPNVYLEFGMAIVLGKPIIAITQNQDDCPTDVRNIKYIVYSKDHADHILEKELPKALRDTISQVEQIAAKRNTQSW